MTLDQLLLVVSLTITSLCNLTLCVASIILFKKTDQKGFAIIAAGFGLWILQQFVFLLSSTAFLVSFGKHIGNIHTSGLVLVAIGFYGLARRALRRGVPDE